MGPNTAAADKANTIPNKTSRMMRGMVSLLFCILWLISSPSLLVIPSVRPRNLTHVISNVRLRDLSGRTPRDDKKGTPSQTWPGLEMTENDVSLFRLFFIVR